MYKFLRFFDKEGCDFGFVYNQELGYFEGKIFLDKVSVGLFENAQIFIVEEFIKNGEKVYGIPISIGSPSLLTTEWKTPEETEIFTYDSEYDSETQKRTILKQDSSKQLSEGTIVEILETGQKIVSDYDRGIIDIGIGINSNQELNVSRSLIMKINGDKIAEIEVYGEIEGEDPRFYTWMNNFLGPVINTKDSIIYRDVDINEPLPNYEEINAKRKELLSEKNEIFGYLGAYKGLINAIKYFGYDNVKLKEWWRNTDYDPQEENSIQYRKTPVIDIFDENVDFNLKEEIRPSFNWKKSNLFTLVYRINEVTDEEDDLTDLPEVDELTEFTIEEILIKLNALKKKLKEYFLPSNGRIIEIEGEGDFFARQGQRQWNYLDRKTQVNLADEVTYEITEPKFNYLQDLREMFIQLRSTVPQKTEIFNGESIGSPGSPASPSSLIWKDLDPNNKEDMREVKEAILDKTIVFDSTYKDSFYGYLTKNFENNEELEDGLYKNDKIQDYLYSLDDPDVPIGYPVQLRNTTISVAWDDMDMTWDQIQYLESATGSLTTWNTIDFSTYYEIEWHIFKEITEDSPQEYSITKKGNIVDFNEIGIILPYKGKYTVELTLRDLNNNFAKNRSGQDIIEVLQKESDFIGYTEKDFDVVTWNDLFTISWDSSSFTWDYPYLETTEFDEFEINWESLNLKNFAYYSDINPWRWNNIEDTKATWDDLYHLYWDGMIKEDDYSLYEWETMNLYEYTWDDSNLTWDEVEKRNRRKVTGERPASFLLYPPKVAPGLSTILGSSGNDTLNGSQIIINEEPYTIISDTFKELLEELKNIVSGELSNWEYNGIFDENDNLNYIQVISKKEGLLGESKIDYIGEIRGDYFAKAFTFNPSLEKIKILDDRKNINCFSLCVFCADNSKIPGKTSYKWEIYNSNSELIYENDKRYLVYFFTEKDEYSIKCEITDGNGNKQSILKNGVIYTT